MSEGIRLIAGLGNPGQQYLRTRHNAGAWFLDALLSAHGAELRPESKFHGLAGRVSLEGQDLRLLFPTTYMNKSGQAVQALAAFYKIPPEQILVVYDELDLPVGSPRLKFGGGPGGHNGIKDIIRALGSNNFHRLRLGIGHPGDSGQVLGYVLGQPSREHEEQIMDAITQSLRVLPLLVKGQYQLAMNTLHTQNTPPKAKRPAAPKEQNDGN